MYKLCLLILLLPFFSCGRQIATPKYTQAQFFNCPSNDAYQADTDFKQLVYTALEMALVEQKDIPDYRLVKDTTKFYVLDTYFKKQERQRHYAGPKIHWSEPFTSTDVPTQIGEVQFCLKSEEELQTIANRTGKFLYISIGDVDIKEDSAVMGIHISWKREQGSRVISMSGGGVIRHFKKVAGKWMLDGEKGMVFIQA